MTDHGHRSAWRAARRQVEALIGTLQAAGISHLPGLRDLARKCGVAPVTMVSVLRSLRDEGVLEVRSRVGTYIAATPAAPPALPGRSNVDNGEITPPLVGGVRAELAQDIRSGRFRLDQPLPSYKELRTRYGASYPTLRKALAALAPTGLVVRRGRSFRISRPAPAPGRDTIVLVARTSDRAALSAYTPRSAEIWRALEQECHRTGTYVKVQDCGTVIEGLKRRADRPGPAAGDTALGYMVWVLGLTAEELRQIGVLLHGRGSPIAFLDEMGELPVPPVIRHNPMVRYFSVANSPHAGELLGRYLLTQGHRRLAFFSPVPGFPWNDNRGIGLDSVYRRAGLDGAVRTFSLPSVADFVSVYQRLERDPPFRGLAGHRARYAGYYGPAYARLHETFYRTQALHMLSTHFWYGAMEPLFREALADPGLTAWVGVTDVIALLCLDFLETKDIAVPGRISVCGFDDTQEALGHGLTSYNYGVTAVTRAMMDHIIGPSSAPPGNRPFPIEIDGAVIERESSGRARVGQQAGR